MATAVGLATVGLVAREAADPGLAIYALSFWHYPLYWWAYRYAAVDPARFRRDAALTKAVALAAFAVAYLTTPWTWRSAAVMAAGFGLNTSAAAALGSARTYYGWELGDVSHRRVTSFPYSVVPHPMLLGNMVAFAGAMLAPQFAAQWWPLAVAHIILNAGLLAMEVFVTPGRPVSPPDDDRAPGPARHDDALARLSAIGIAVVASTVAWARPGGAAWPYVAVSLVTAVHFLTMGAQYTRARTRPH